MFKQQSAKVSLNNVIFHTKWKILPKLEDEKNITLANEM